MKSKIIRYLHHKNILAVLVILPFLIITSMSYQDKAFSLHFVDEDDNLVLGKYLLHDEQVLADRNKKIYSDLFSHHQPLAYIFSAGIQQMTEPNSIYLLMKRHREAIIFWSILWSILLVVRFGYVFVVPIIIYEFSKIYLLGNLFLSESLVVYPLAYISGWILLHKKEIIWEFVLLGLLFSLCIFLLSPLWPLLAFMFLVILIKNFSLKRTFIFLAGMIPVIIIVLRFISLPDYLYNAFFINFKYYIPITTPEPIYISFLKGLFTPILAWIQDVKNSGSLGIIRVTSLLFLPCIILLIKNGQRKKALVIFLILGLANIRFVQPGLDFYSGFHILPWFFLYLSLSFIAFFSIFKNIPGKNEYSRSNVRNLLAGNNKFALLGVIPLIFIITFISSQEYLFKKIDPTDEIFINYSRQFSIGEAVRILANKDDRLFIAPDEWLVYWQADIQPSSKMLNFYDWMNKVPELRGIVDSTFENNPPEFVYLNMKGTGFEDKLFEYKKIYKDSSETGLYIKDPPVLSNQQKADLDFHGIKIEGADEI